MRESTEWERKVHVEKGNSEEALRGITQEELRNEGEIRKMKEEGRILKQEN